VGSRRSLGTGSAVVEKYKEVQVHGAVALAEHVEAVMVHPDEAPGLDAGALSAACGGAPVIFLEASDVDR